VKAWPASARRLRRLLIEKAQRIVDDDDERGEWTLAAAQTSWLPSGAVRKLTGVRAVPGRKVALSFRPDGWFVEKEPGFLDDVEHEGPLAAAGFVALGLLAFGIQLGSAPFLWVAAILGVPVLVIVTVLGVLNILASVVGVPWAGRLAVTRRGRRRLRQQWRQLLESVGASGERGAFIPRTRIRSGKIYSDFIGRVVVVLHTTDDRQLRYSSWIHRKELEQGFRALLGHWPESILADDADNTEASADTNTSKNIAQNTTGQADATSGA